MAGGLGPLSEAPGFIFGNRGSAWHIVTPVFDATGIASKTWVHELLELYFPRNSAVYADYRGNNATDGRTLFRELLNPTFEYVLAFRVHANEGDPVSHGILVVDRSAIGCEDLIFLLDAHVNVRAHGQGHCKVHETAPIASSVTRVS